MRVAVDIGGTFTDLVVQGDDGVLAAFKASTTPEDHGQGLLEVLGRSSVDLAAVSAFTHGTTVALNALLQRDGAATGLITTAGFRDVLELMRAARPHHFDMQADKPTPLVSRSLRLEAHERVGADGEVLIPVDTAEVVALAESLNRRGCDSVAICFLFAFKNPANEMAAAAAIREALPDLSVSCSSEITREWREFERTSTTVINAFCRPPVERYVSRIGAELRERRLKPHVRYMQSNGGVMSADEAARFPVRTILSGPVGGVIAAEHLATTTAHQNMLTLDIGGTSADVALLTGGEVSVRAAKDIDGWPILFPAVDIRAVGAGGGSIAAVDDVGRLTVGPRSAGADPGPACYGRGGQEPTVTDAHVVLGVIDPDYFLGGELRLDPDAAARAITNQVARPLGLDLADAAKGILELVDVTMAGALREISVQQGHDLRQFALAAFGGAGGLHAAALCRELGIPEMIVPVNPAVFSASGMLHAPLKHSFSQTVLLAVASAEASGVRTGLEVLEDRCAAKLAEDGVTLADCDIEWIAEMRYAQQDSVIPISVEPTEVSVADLVAAFSAAHERAFGYSMEDPVVIANLRVTVSASTDDLPVRRETRPEGSKAQKATREIRLRRGEGAVEVPIYDRDCLSPGMNIVGPAVVEEPQSTTLVGPGDVLNVDDLGHLCVEINNPR